MGAIKNRFSFVVCAASLVSCAQVRAVTYGPDFHYVDKASIRTAMDRLAQGVIEINQALAGHQDIDLVTQATVIEQLEDMRAALATISPGDLRSNHPRFDEHLQGFQKDLDDALLDARSNPPRYYLAGNIAGGCLACHAAARSASPK